MEPFELAVMPEEAFDVEWTMQRFKCDKRTAEDLVEFTKGQTVVMNDIYQVNIRRAEVGPGWPDMIHLSIKRRDKQPFHDWRVLQTIKNMIVGPENEGVELYPAESRLTDTSNQYHLFVLADKETRFPFGFRGRVVSDSKSAEDVGAVQRDFA